MPDYQRYRVPAMKYFFTVNLLGRRLDTLVRHINVLRDALRVTKWERPFYIDALVVLPDHMHSSARMQEVRQRMKQLPSVWILPQGDVDFSNRWKAIKIRFVQKLPATERRSKVRAAKGELGRVAMALLGIRHSLSFCMSFSLCSYLQKRMTAKR